MPSTIESLFWIVACSALAPLLTGLFLRNLVPEVVVLMVLGILIGPHALDLAVQDQGIEVLRNLGLGMLFLLAGYEIDHREVTGPGGRRALVTWLVSLAVALAVVAAAGSTGRIHAELAVAIAATSTALGTLLPILKDSNLMASRFGQTLMNHGAYGELGPVIAMAVLLGSRGPVQSLVFLASFGLVAVAVHHGAVRMTDERLRVLAVVRGGADTSGQTPVRLVVFLLVALFAAASAFDLDAVLGAFAAGFILRRLLPAGNEDLESRLGGLAFGLLIPIFFVTAGMAIDPVAPIERPLTLVTFLMLILLARGAVVLFATRTTREHGRAVFDRDESRAMGLFASTGLPIIVAVTAVAVDAGQMAPANASVLVAGGALTVLVCPLLAQWLLRPRLG
jgi:Kef-type K+ transport system membrane component KefB